MYWAYAANKIFGYLYRKETTQAKCWNLMLEACANEKRRFSSPLAPVFVALKSGACQSQFVFRAYEKSVTVGIITALFNVMLSLTHTCTC